MLQLYIDEKLSLRLFTEEDTQELFLLTMQSRKHLQKWLGWIHAAYSIEDTHAFIRDTWEQIAKNGGHPLNFGIIYDGRIAGTIGFHTFNRLNRSASVGYWLGEPFVGKGIMTKSFYKLLEYGFESLHLHRIEVRAAEGNLKSRAIPERFGFKQEGVIREAEWLYDHYVNHVVYGLLKHEWEELKKTYSIN